jgi:uncharacterized membrane protein YagU involved in acid resistance
MVGDSAFWRLGERNALTAIAVGGFASGVLDLAQVIIVFAPKAPLDIAAGLLGQQATANGGAGLYTLGVFLHFFICFSAAAVYYVASRWLVFLKEHPLVCGLAYGAAVELVMLTIILPLSALHDHGPYESTDLLVNLLGIHMVTIGLPISFSVWRFGK